MIDSRGWRKLVPSPQPIRIIEIDAIRTLLDTLEGTAATAVALARGQPADVPWFTDPAAVRARLARLAAPERRGPALLGLYTGGTLAHEAQLLLEHLLGPLDTGAEAHRVLDLGADELTVGRPHPMIDPSERGARIRAVAPEVGVLLVDIVLGRAAHAHPAQHRSPRRSVTRGRPPPAPDARSQ